MRRRLLLGGVLGGVLVLSVVVAPGAHAEVPVSQVGWWTRSPTPPTVPEGGISVAAAPDGPLTVGAVLLDAGGGASGASVRLVETGGEGQQLGGLQVCPTSSAWSPAEAGAMADAPKDDCASATVAMARGDDGTWTADVQSLVDGKTGPVGLIVLPAAGSVAFQVTFAPPIVDGSVTDESDSSSESTSDAFEPSTSSSGSFSTDTGSFTVPSAPAVPEVPVTTATTAPAATIAPSNDVAASTFSGGLPIKTVTGDHVTKATVLLWYLAAIVFGSAVAGLSWVRAEGHLSPAALLRRHERPRA
jgi:hypothetical protein